MADKWKDQRADWQAKRVDKKHGPGDKQIDRLQRRLDRDEQWFADWVSGLSHREIAEKYDVHIRTVAGWASAHRWRERRADLRRELFEAKEKARLATAPHRPSSGSSSATRRRSTTSLPRGSLTSSMGGRPL